MPAKGNKRYGYLLEDPQITRWYDNVARGSRITADVYLRRFGSVLEEKNLSPQDILKLGQGDLFNLLLDLISKMEKDGYAGSYTQSVVKAVKSWLQFNHIVLVGRMRIRGTEETPTLVEESVPSQQELSQILNAAGLREKVAIMLVASGGGRIEILGSYDGSDGLRLRDFPDVTADNATKTVTLQRMPVMFVVRVPISKARHQYFSFLCDEGCIYLKEYLEQRMRDGEALTPDSPIILRCQTWQSERFRKNPFINTPNVGDMIREVMRAAGFKERPYVLRNYFDSRLLVAESERQILRDFRVFFMGHKGDIEHRYTLNRHKLAPDLVEKMRDSYKRSQKYLQTTTPVSSEDDIPSKIRKQMLLTVGYKQEEIEKLNLSETSDDAVQDLMRQRLFAVMMNNGQRQKIVSSEEVEKLVAGGWEWMGNLSDGRAVLRLPA